MKLNNMKKSILMTIIYCMGLGGITLTIGGLYPANHKDDVAETLNRDNEIVASSYEGSEDNLDKSEDISGSDLANAYTTTNAGLALANETITPEPTPTPLPVYDIIVGGHQEIDKFFQDYYVAWNSCDYDLLKNLTTNPENTIPLLDLKKETRFLDDIRDTTCYVTKSYEDNSYIVYVYYEIKYVNIKTTLPRLDKFYLITDSDGNLKIFNSEMDETLKAYFDERDQDSVVSGIIESTNDKAKAALEKDESLRVYVEALYRN